MRILFRSIITLVLCIAGMTAKAELTNDMFDVRHIGYSEGLSSQRVFSIVEDKNGAMWIATKAGIDRYNGHIVKNYTLSGDFYYGDLAGRRIHLLYDQSELWAYDHTGRVYRYSAQNDSFEQELYLEQFVDGEIILNKLYVDPKGTRWFGLNTGLYKQEIDGNVTPVIQEQYVNDVVAVNESLFVGTSTGVLQLSYPQTNIVHQLINGQDVQTLFCDTIKNELWIGTFNNGLLVMDLNTLDLLPLKEQSAGFLNPIRTITNYNSRTILVGIDGGGVYVVERELKTARLLMNTEDSTNAFLRGNGIYAVTKDHQGNLWIGSYTGGVSVAILLENPIIALAHERGNVQSLADNNINDIEENVNGDLWFATDLGISAWNVASRTWNHWLKGVVAVTLCRGNNGSMWVGTYGDGVYLLDRQGRVIRHLIKQQGELTTNSVLSIKQDMDGDLWIGGLDGQLIMMKRGEARQRQVYDIKWIQSITMVSRNQIAVATVNGFYLINKDTEEIQHYATAQEFYHQNASAYVVSMLFNDDNTVWLGTEGGGLNLYNMQTKELRTFTTREGLPSNDVYGLQRDAVGRLWASTGKGLALIDNFKVSNLNYMGDIDKEYNKSSFARLSSGRFVYGSTNGAVFVTPNAITTTDYQAPLRFTGLTIDYLSADEEKRLRPVMYDMLTNGIIQLDYKYNSFVITFESINYHFQRDIVYQYMLDGYEKQWSDPSADGMVRYTNVSPGSYLLKVRSLRRSDGEIISEHTLMLKVAQPWWNSWWAWVCYICIAGAIFYFIWRYKSNQLQKRHDEDKIRFFINTAHDIRTPVTLVMAPLEDVYKEKGLSDNALYFLDLARNNIRKLNTLITQLLDFEKVSANKLQISLTSLNLNDILAEEAASFQSFCDKKQLQLNLSLPNENVCVMADRHTVEMLLDNLISNACKYTMPQGSISLSLSCTKRKAVIEVKDSGIGIPQKARKYLFSDVYRAENARESQEDGTGFGLLQVHRIVKMLRGKITFQSEENKGSTFTVTLNRTDVAPESIPQQTLALEKPLLTETENVTKYVSQEGKNSREQTAKDTLLIVEDHEALRYYLRKTFEQDYRVVDVDNGKEALSYLSSEYPDLILSDVMMPGIQGDELCKLVKENPDTSGIPFILLTAKVNHDAVVDGLKKGADDYIPKPFSTEILKLKVQGLIDNRNRQRDFFMRQAIEQVESGKNQTDGKDSDETFMHTMSENDSLFITQVTQLIIKNIDDIDFNINTLCQEMAMSRTLFFSRLKSLTGKGPQEFIRIIRLQKAAELLKEGKSVTEVAADTGFVNTKYFSSLFKKQFGVQPSKYGKVD